VGFGPSRGPIPPIRADHIASRVALLTTGLKVGCSSSRRSSDCWPSILRGGLERRLRRGFNPPQAFPARSRPKLWFRFCTLPGHSYRAPAPRLHQRRPKPERPSPAVLAWDVRGPATRARPRPPALGPDQVSRRGIRCGDDGQRHWLPAEGPRQQQRSPRAISPTSPWLSFAPARVCAMFPVC
jgi:hypothetical protein